MSGGKSLYRRGVGICLVDRYNRALVGKRLDDPTDSWQMPQGGLWDGEKPFDAALRELFEETCITSVSFLHELEEWKSYPFPPQRARRKGAEHVIGQTHKWFLFRFTGPEEEVDVQRAKDQEFSQHTWMPLHHLPPQVVEYKKDVYEAVCSEFSQKLAELENHNGEDGR